MPIFPRRHDITENFDLAGQLAKEGVETGKLPPAHL
jgi:hypothetical protein